MRAQAGQPQPFFLYLAFTIPHAQYEVPDLGIYADKGWPDAEKRVAAMVTRMDASIGQLLETLKQNGGRNNVNQLTQGGVVFGAGFTPEQLQRAVSTVAGPLSRTALISNVASLTTSTGAVNPSLYAPNPTPGQYGSFVYLRNNTSDQFDMSLNKEVRITERWRLTLRAVALNFLNRPFFAIGNVSPTATTFGQITTAAGTRTVQLRGSIEW